MRSLSELRGYWNYLRSTKGVPDEVFVFDKLTLPRAGKNGRADERSPFEPADMVRLLKVAREDRQDEALASLIELAMYTGARIEELCALPIDKVHGSSKGYIEIEDSKTSAGWRQVPIHSKLKATVARLAGDCKMGFVLVGLEANKYHDRSAAIGKRFGRLKTALGFGKRHVFHCIRRTVATLFVVAAEEAGSAAPSSAG